MIIFIPKKMLKILWVHDHFNGPENGLAEYNNKKVWFQLVNDKFNIIKLSNEKLELIEEDHKKYCQILNKPQLFEDNYNIRNRTQIKKNISQEGPFEAIQKSMTGFKIHIHSYNPLEVEGELITTLNKKDIENYSIPHKIL
jgi:hypothetical protein